MSSSVFSPYNLRSYDDYLAPSDYASSYQGSGFEYFEEDFYISSSSIDESMNSSTNSSISSMDYSNRHAHSSNTSSQTSSQTSSNPQSTTQVASSHDANNNNYFNDALFARILKGDNTCGYRMVMQNEISYRIEPVPKDRDVVDEDAEIGRLNMAWLVEGQGRMCPERRLKGWGTTEIGRGTGLGRREVEQKKQGVLEEEDLIDLCGATETGKGMSMGKMEEMNEAFTENLIEL